VNTPTRRIGVLRAAQGRMQRVIGFASDTSHQLTEAAAGLPIEEALKHSRLLDRLGRLSKLANELKSELAQLEGENLENDESPNRPNPDRDAVLSATGSDFALAGSSG
jgi:hypothetical protein